MHKVMYLEFTILVATDTAVVYNLTDGWCDILLFL